MFSYRTIAGFGAAALAFLALTRISKHCQGQDVNCPGEYVKKAAGRVEGVIRRRTGMSIDPTNDVI
ncbi:MAG: hypothetical protein PHT62_03790 [Desulfotomaculaceae bacterium]|nr:hypothetical protein [Desulfotomaculaceae bacterium]